MRGITGAVRIFRVSGFLSKVSERSVEQQSLSGGGVLLAWRSDLIRCLSGMGKRQGPEHSESRIGS